MTTQDSANSLERNLRLGEIADAYYATLPLDGGNKIVPQFCVGIIGVLGAGKTTVVRMLQQQQLPAIRHSGDDIRTMLPRYGIPVQDLAALVVCSETQRRLVEEGHSVIYDGDLADPRVRAEVTERNKAAGVHEFWIRVHAPEPFIIAKLRNHPPSPLFDDSEAAVSRYQERKALHAREAGALATLSYIHEFDSTAPDLRSQAASCAAKILLCLGPGPGRQAYADSTPVFTGVRV